jgi:hypothetical protein
LPSDCCLKISCFIETSHNDSAKAHRRLTGAAEKQTRLIRCGQ